MKKRAKLTQEQLKSVLQGWKTTLLACCVWDIGEYFSDEHVYTQIEELIEDSDAITVTREKMVDELFMKRGFGLNDVNRFADWLKELGVEVIEPETIH